MQEEVQQPETSQVVKRHYEKPSLAQVRLFADMVLNYCSSDLCQPDPDKISG